MKFITVANFIIVVILLLILGNLSRVHAQEGAVIITWEADNFYPSNYPGKAYPTKYSRVLLSAQLVVNGSIIDLTKPLGGDTTPPNVSWYADGNFINGGPGMQTVSFQPINFPGDSHSIRVLIRGGGGAYESTYVLPVSSPQIAIDAPYPLRNVRPQSQLELVAVPYFWNITSLNNLEFFWEAGKEKQRGVGKNSITTEARRTSLLEERFNITVSAQNIDRVVESAVAKIQLFIR